MKKMLIFGGIIIALFVAIFAVTQMEEKMPLVKRLIILLKVRQTVLTTTQIKFLFQIFKRT